MSQEMATNSSRWVSPLLSNAACSRWCTYNVRCFSVANEDKQHMRVSARTHDTRRATRDKRATHLRPRTSAGRSRRNLSDNNHVNIFHHSNKYSIFGNWFLLSQLPSEQFADYCFQSVLCVILIYLYWFRHQSKPYLCVVIALRCGSVCYQAVNYNVLLL